MLILFLSLFSRNVISVVYVQASSYNVYVAKYTTTYYSKIPSETKLDS
jgi:hypothetical protein